MRAALCECGLGRRRVRFYLDRSWGSVRGPARAAEDGSGWPADPHSAAGVDDSNTSEDDFQTPSNADQDSRQRLCYLYCQVLAFVPNLCYRGIAELSNKEKATPQQSVKNKARARRDAATDAVDA